MNSRYAVTRLSHLNKYETPLFTVTISKRRKDYRQLTVFSNGHEAVAVFLGRGEVAQLLRDGFRRNRKRNLYA